MADKPHSEVVVGSRHAPHNLTYPDASNREAGTNEGSSIVVATANLYQYAKQDDDNSIWMLTGIGPPLTWLRVTSTGGGDFSTSVSTVIDETIVVMDGTSGKIGKDSVAKVIEVTNENKVQLEDPNAAGVYLDAVKLKYTAPNGTPGGTQTAVGNQTKTLLLESSGDHFVDTAGKRAITELISSAWSVPQRGTITHTGADSLPALQLINTGANAGECRFYTGDRTPEGAVTALQGSLYIRADGDNSDIYIKATGTGAAGWVSLNQ